VLFLFILFSAFLCGLLEPKTETTEENQKVLFFGRDN
jgi:hypothetical protein